VAGTVSTIVDESPFGVTQRGYSPSSDAETVVPDFDCERFSTELFGQPVNTVSSLAFVIAGVAILARGQKRFVYGSLVALNGAGSVALHGPYPPWADLAHDLPLVALTAYVAVDAAADLRGRPLSAAWWLTPVVAAVPIVAVAPELGDLVQAGLAVVAVALSLQRARVRPALRRTIVTSMAVLGVGALIGTLTRSGAPLCDPDSLFQGHAAWHVLAAIAMWMLAPVVGSIGNKLPAPA
jgi:hypothetical protein